MLAKRRSIRLNGQEIERTPLLVPSFSSKGFPDVEKILKATEEVIEGPLLVSAYDLHYKFIAQALNFPSLVFLDSGGYEASKDVDLSDILEREHSVRTWTQEMHREVVNGWSATPPTVLITYDHPKERVSLQRQVENAKRLTEPNTRFVREILLKPETINQTLVQVKTIVEQVHSLADFDIIGVTEKEIGNSVLDRMKNIAELRVALNKAGLETPIHVFGSLDTITTPLYFLAGADIFDGLTWLRFAYYDGYTMYKQNYGAIELGVREKAHIIDGRCWNHNYGYLRDLELEMRRFLKDDDFAVFRHHGDLFRDASQNTLEALGA